MFTQEQQGKLASLKYALEETKDVSNELLQQLPEDDNANAEVPEQVTKLDELYTEVNDLIDRALTSEKENLAKHGEFEALLDGFTDKVDSLEKRLQDPKSLSAKLPELKAEQEEIMVRLLFREIFLSILYTRVSHTLDCMTLTRLFPRVRVFSAFPVSVRNWSIPLIMDENISGTTLYIGQWLVFFGEEYFIL